MPRAKERPTRPSLEILEQRDLLTTAILEGSTIVITGTPNADLVYVWGPIPVATHFYLRVEMGGPGGDVAHFEATLVDSISFTGHAGDDHFTNDTFDVPCIADGGTGETP